MRYVLGHRLLRPQAIATGTSNFFSNLVFAIFIVYAVRRLGMSAAAVGLVFSLGSIGWLLGSMSADRIRRRLGVGLTTTLGMACTGPSLLLRCGRSGLKRCLLNLGWRRLFRRWTPGYNSCRSLGFHRSVGRRWLPRRS